MTRRWPVVTACLIASHDPQVFRGLNHVAGVASGIACLSGSGAMTTVVTVFGPPSRGALKMFDTECRAIEDRLVEMWDVEASQSTRCHGEGQLAGSAL